MTLPLVTGQREMAVPVCLPSLLLAGDHMVASTSALTPPKQKSAPKTKGFPKGVSPLKTSLFAEVLMGAALAQTGARGTVFMKVLTGTILSAPSPATEVVPNKGSSPSPHY